MSDDAKLNKALARIMRRIADELDAEAGRQPVPRRARPGGPREPTAEEREAAPKLDDAKVERYLARRGLKRGA